ncbi:MAG: CrcB family protein [Nakamurella sp.]
MPQTDRRFDTSAVVAVFVGGAMGAAARAGLEVWFPVRVGAWPWATFTANVVGAAALAVVLLLVPERGTGRRYRLMLGTGACGGLTTFSTLQVEVFHLIRFGETGFAVAYLAASIVAALAAAHVVTRIVAMVRVEEAQ